MTLQTQLVLRVLLSDPTQTVYGLQLCEATGLAAGTVYPILTRLVNCGWVDSRWETPDEQADAGRPRRKYYRLTGEGAREAGMALAEAHQQSAAVRRWWEQGLIEEGPANA
ncbi:PadR family transcriptional regulator [Nocardiopsis sp. N85]|uniref:PadR family transcriptional regulator n=1 Tax=Nocardiopsis sp. N85 TaxID=3029400 RepID=UPI00237FB46B|nr:PadR family transcriptional regulator [Nocardiopsis sp. N85]MDE3720833.1 PadR family transcriptional regulator [Nocardiopsis sp. N85]